MCKAVVLCVFALAFAAKDDGYYWFQYGKFVSEFRPETDLGASNSRFEIFKENLQYIEAHNALDRPYKLGVNQFADMTYEEFRDGYLGCAGNETLGELHEIAEDGVLANDVDWKNTLPAVKNQKSCGSCWAFSAVGAVEGRHRNVNLSEQQLVDCSTANHGCNGGSYTSAFTYIKSAGGLDSENGYPYTAKDGKCKFNKSGVKARVTGYKSVQGEAALKSALNSGVVSVHVDASKDFMHYSSGVFTGACSSSSHNHAILAVGYSGSKYYTVRNSWGTTWGEKGYIRMVQGKNICGIANGAAYPTTA